MSEFAPLKSLFESALAFGLSGTKSQIIFKLITTKNKKKKYSSRQICEIKLFNTLSDSLSSSFFCNTGTQKAPFSKGLGVCVWVWCSPLSSMFVCVWVCARLPNLQTAFSHGWTHQCCHLGRCDAHGNFSTPTTVPLLQTYDTIRRQRRWTIAARRLNLRFLGDRIDRSRCGIAVVVVV